MYSTTTIQEGKKNERGKKNSKYYIDAREPAFPKIHK